MHPELDRLLDSSFVEELSSLDMDALRSRRAECQTREESVSYLRRVIQVRLDLVGTELVHRQSGDSRAGTADLVSRLPEILSERGRAPGMGQAPRTLRLPDIEGELTAMVDEVASPAQLSDLAGLDDDALAGVVEQLGALEQEVSAFRRKLHGQLDVLQAEVTRRYRSGEATVDSLLR